MLNNTTPKKRLFWVYFWQDITENRRRYSSVDLPSHFKKSDPAFFADVTGQPWENRLNWIPNLAPATSRDHGIEKSPEGPKEDKENRPPASHSSRIPRKIRPRRRKRTPCQQHLPGTNENSPGIDLRHRWMKRTPQKHPQPPQLPQHPLSAANENSSRVNLWNQADPGRLYKQARGSRVKESTKRSRRDYFSGSSPSFSSKQPRQDYFSGPSPHSRACKGPDTELVPQPQTHQGCTQAEPQGRAISLQQAAATRCPITRSHLHAQLVPTWC